MKVLITGATGFIGSRLVRKLVDEGNDVHIIIRPNSPLDQLSTILDRLKLHVFDGTTKNMFSLMEKATPEVTFHLASMAIREHSANDLESLIQSNITFGAQITEGMLHSGCQLMVNTGTFWQHYENRDYSPVNLYAASKQAFEAILQYYVEARSLKVITLQLFDTYGPDDPRPKLFSLLRKAAKLRNPLPMSPGEQLIDAVYIDDVINAYLIAADRLVCEPGLLHESYAVSSFNPIRLRDLVSIYEKVTNTMLDVRWGGRPYGDREVMLPWNRGKQLPGWKCQVDLVNGIKSLDQGLRERK